MRTDNLFDFLFGFHYKSYYQGKKTECQGFFDFIDFFFSGLPPDTKREIFVLGIDFF